MLVRIMKTVAADREKAHIVGLLALLVFMIESKIKGLTRGEKLGHRAAGDPETVMSMRRTDHLVFVPQFTP